MCSRLGMIMTLRFWAIQTQNTSCESLLDAIRFHCGLQQWNCFDNDSDFSMASRPLTNGTVYVGLDILLEAGFNWTLSNPSLYSTKQHIKAMHIAAWDEPGNQLWSQNLPKWCLMWLFITGPSLIPWHPHTESKVKGEETGSGVVSSNRSVLGTQIELIVQNPILKC